MEFDFSDVEKVITEITEKHADKIRDNEAFAQLLNELSESNDKKNAILEELANASKLTYEYAVDVMEYAKNLSSIVRLIDTRLSALEIAVQHIEKGNEKFVEWNDNLQDQIDILAGELSEKTSIFSNKKEKKMKCSRCNSESNRLRYYRDNKGRQYLCIKCHPKPEGMDKEYKREDYAFICKEKVK